MLLLIKKKRKEKKFFFFVMPYVCASLRNTRTQETKQGSSISPLPTLLGQQSTTELHPVLNSSNGFLSRVIRWAFDRGIPSSACSARALIGENYGPSLCLAIRNREVCRCFPVLSLLASGDGSRSLLSVMQNSFCQSEDSTTRFLYKWWFMDWALPSIFF